MNITRGQCCANGAKMAVADSLATSSVFIMMIMPAKLWIYLLVEHWYLD